MGGYDVPFELMTGSTLSGHSELLSASPPNSDRTPGMGGGTHRLSLFTMLFRGLGEVVLASAAASISQDRA